MLDLEKKKKNWDFRQSTSPAGFPMHDNSGGGLVTNDLKNLFLPTYATSLTMFSVILIKFAVSAISQKWPAVARKSASLDFSLELMTKKRSKNAWFFADFWI